MQDRADIGDQGAQRFGKFLGAAERRVEVQGGGVVEVLQHEVVVLHDFRELVGELLRMEHVAETQSASRRPVLVRRTDAAAGGADLAVAEGFFPRRVQCDVIGQDQRTRRRDAQVVADIDALFFELLDFLHQRVRRYGDAVADETLHVGPQDARRNEVQHGSLALDDEGMSGVVSALKTHCRRRLLGQAIDDLALALVSPLGAEHDDAASHFSLYSQI